MKKRRLQQLFKLPPIKKWSRVIAVLGCLLIQNIGYSQTALKWSAYLADDYYLAPWAMHLDEVNDRLYVVGTITEAPTYTNSLGLPYGGGTDIGLFCLSPDGTTVYWQAYWGGTGNDTPKAINTNATGDVFIGGRTSSSDFPIYGTTTAYDATPNASGDAFIYRISADGTTLQYSTFIGEVAEIGSKSMVVDGDIVYICPRMTSGGNLPIAGNSFQPTNNGGVSDGALIALNTAISGNSGLLWSTYFGGTDRDIITDIKLAPDGQLVVLGNTEAVGDGTENFPVTSNAIQTPASIMGIIPSGTQGQFVAKFTTTGDLTYSTLFYPSDNSGVGNFYLSALEIDAAGNIYTIEGYYNYSATVANFESIPNNQLNVLTNGVFDHISIICKIPADLSPALDFMTVLPQAELGVQPLIKVDEKGRIHALYQAYTNPQHSWSFDGAYETPGTLPETNSRPWNDVGVYSILSPSGASIEYTTFFDYFYNDNAGLIINDAGDVYIALGDDSDESHPTTPSYYDAEAGVQKTVFNAIASENSVSYKGGIMVFYDPLPNENTITDFAPGNNTFCVNGLIYQDPSEGPILGNSPSYVSGDGSSPTHNLPDVYISRTGETLPHPTPASPNAKYQWEKSYDGTIWESIAGANLEVLKPEAEGAAGTVQYRRLFITAACDTMISNVATATITGTFGLDISIAEEPVYYCPGTAKSMGVTISGASGNISWQWYNGFEPLTTEVSPASGTGAAGSFTADIAASATEGGSYRLVVTDAGGCKKEAFVTIEPLTAPASQGGDVVLCPGTTPSVVIGPAATNPDFDYSWTGPSGFTSSIANPTATEVGTYTLEVKLTSDVAFCVGGATTVTIAAPTPFDAALMAIPDSEFCQSDDPAPIGLSGSQPSGYVYQWAPGINLDNAQAYSPNFDPGSLPFEVTPISEVEYTFTALRLSDGCIFETTTMVSDTARALAQAGIDLPSCGNFQTFGAPETTGDYWEWRAVATTYPGDVAALIAHADFSMDGSTTNLSTNKFLTGGFPSHNACYTIDYELIASYTPFPANCITRDTVRLFYCPTCGGDWCSDLTSNTMGTDGACSGTSTIIGGSSLGGLSYTWTTYSVDGVVQPANTAPQGLFEKNDDDTKGTALVGGAAHASQVIADFDDATWGWSGANVVIYRLIANGNFGEGEIDCHRDIQVFSAADASPVIAVLDQSFCVIETPAIRLGAMGKDAPYTISGVDYTQAPNSALDWQWTDLSGNGSITADATTPFPTLEPTTSTSYQVVVADPVTGCVATDTLFADIVTVVTNAGEDITDVCDGTLVQLGAPATANHTYSWNPTAGLSSPANTPNSMVANPFLLVGGDITYTVTVTETTTGCQATDMVAVTTTTDAPPVPSANSYNACADAVFEIGPSSYTTPYVTYSWSTNGGSADIAWLSATDVLNPTVSLPNSFASSATFRLTVSRGSCPSSTQDYVIDPSTPVANLGVDVTYDCTTSTIELTTGFTSGYEYAWSPITELYTNSSGAANRAYDGSFSSSRYRIYASPTTTTTYTITMRDRETGCSTTDDITVTVPIATVADAGADINYCPGSGVVALGASGTGATFTWAATGYTDSPYGYIDVPTIGDSTTMMSYLSNPSSTSTNFEQTTYTPGKYVYTLTATDGACSTSDEITVIVPDLGTAPLVGVSTSVCEGESVTLGVENPLGQASYFWRAINPTSQSASINDGSSPNPIVNPTVTTTYELTATDGLTGCTITESITVTVTQKPNIADVDMAIQCAPISAVDLTAQIPSYGTYFNSAWSIQTPNGQAVLIDTTAIYSHSFDNLTGWTINPSSTDNATDGFWAAGNPSSSGFQNDNAFEGSNALITGLNNTTNGNDDVDGGTTSIVSPVQNIPSFAPKAILSFYYYYAHNSNGSSSNDFFRVTVKGSTDKVIINRLNENSSTSPNWQLFSVDISEYIGQSVSVLFELNDEGNGVGEAGVDLFNISTTSLSLVSPIQTTNYYVVLENEFGCADTALVTVNVDNPKAPNIITNVATNCPATSIDLADYQGTPSDPAFTLEWHTDNTINPATLLSNTVVSASGTYYLFETTPNGCSSASDNSVYVAEACCPAQNCGGVTVTVNNN